MADAHAFASYLMDALPSKSDKIFKDSETERCEILVPSIAFAELIYVFEKTDKKSKIWDMFDRLDANPSIKVQPLDEEVLKLVPDVKLKELHDRIIVATCILVKAKQLITKDEEIAKAEIVRTVW